MFSWVQHTSWTLIPSIIKLWDSPPTFNLYGAHPAIHYQTERCIQCIWALQLPPAKKEQWRTQLAFMLWHCWLLSPAAKPWNELDLLSSSCANLLIAPRLYLKLFSWGRFSLLLTVKQMCYKKRFFVFKQLGNNARTTKQIQYSLDFFKMSKTMKTCNWCPKQF